MADALADIIEREVQGNPDRIALRFERREISYGALWGLVLAVTHHLIGAGVRSGDRVA